MGGNFCTVWESKISQHSALHYSVHKYIYIYIYIYIYPVCPYHLTLRYCSCNTYLLHRRAELKAAPGSTCLMRNWTLGNNEQLAASIYVCGVICYFVLNERNNWPLIDLVGCFVLRMLSVSFCCTIHHQSLIVGCMYIWKQFILFCVI